MKFAPFGHIVLLKKLDGEYTSAAGIIIPVTSQTKYARGTVAAVGPGYLVEGKYVPLEAKVGDLVLYDHRYCEDIRIDGETFVLVKDEYLAGSYS